MPDVRINALAMMGALLLSGLVIVPAGAAAQPGYENGYTNSKTPTLSRTPTAPSASLPAGTKSPSRPPLGRPPQTSPAATSSAAVTRSQTDQLPVTGSGLAVTGVMVAGTGIGFLAAWWLWQARVHGRTRVRRSPPGDR